MSPKWKTVCNGVLEGITSIPDLDPSKLTVTLSPNLKPLPELSQIKFGQCMTDHMLVVSFDPETGWGAPEIKPYAPIPLDPISSCLQYATTIFEGMKVYSGADSQPRLFRPDLNMARFNTSASRVALPPFNPDSLLTLIKRLVQVESRWIPTLPNHALYLRPTMLGTRTGLAQAASDHAMIYVVCCPSGPYFHNPRSIRILAVSEIVRSWPGGTGGWKLGLNYSPGFTSLRSAFMDGWDQILWLLPSDGGKDMKITEAGPMNFFVVVDQDEEGWEVITPSLDGTILPGITRSSILELISTHGNGRLDPPLAHIPASRKIRAVERTLTMAELSSWAKNGKLLEAFGVGTAVLVIAVGEIGVEGKDKLVTETILLPSHKMVLGPVAAAIHDRLVDIQEGRIQFNDWSVICD